VDVEDAILLFISIWILSSAILAGSTEVFLVLVLIGLLITLEISGFFLDESRKGQLKPIIQLLLFIFTIIVLRKVYEVLK